MKCVETIMNFKFCMEVQVSVVTQTRCLIKAILKNIHLARINLHTSPCNSSAMGNRKSRLNYFHKILKALTLEKFKREFINNDHSCQHQPYPLFTIVCNATTSTFEPLSPSLWAWKDNVFCLSSWRKGHFLHMSM